MTVELTCKLRLYSCFETFMTGIDWATSVPVDA